MTLKTVIHRRLLDFGHKTNIAGLNIAFNSKSTSKKCFWFLLFLIGSCLTFNNFSKVFINYYDFNVTTSTDVTTEESVIYPGVTLCNLNKYEKVTATCICVFFCLCMK